MPKIASLLTALSLVTLTGCGSLMMSVNDMHGSDTSVLLIEGAQVYVAEPTISDDVARYLDKVDYSPREFTGQVKRKMVRALQERGVVASTQETEGASKLYIKITEFGEGSGAMRFFVGGGWGDSSLDGTAILMTPHGKRELQVEKVGKQSGGMEFLDQTSENIGYFTTALAAKITG